MSISKHRLRGVDLCRGLAAYAVILVHSGDETWGVSVSNSAVQFRLIFYFAVPFFLATAFYFLTRKTTVDISLKFWRSRIKRILIPYAMWSLIYVALRVPFYLISGGFDRLAEYLQDPVSLVFLGGASYQLYFLPLLIAGTLLLPIAKYLVDRQTQTKKLAVLAIAGIVINEIVFMTGNSFRLGENAAFPGLLALSPPGIGYEIKRFILVQIAWMIRCFPYIVMAIILDRLLATNKLMIEATSSQVSSKRLTALLFVLFVLTATFGKILLPNSLQEILVAYLLLLTGIISSTFLKADRLAASIGACSFGIYLLHPIPMNLVTTFMEKIYPQLMEQVSVVSMLTISVPTFFLSWFIVETLNSSKGLARFLFGS